MNTTRVLVVDDDDDYRESMVSWLRSKGYAVDAVESGLRALDVVKGTWNSHAVALIDQIMPGGLDGIETMERIHAVQPELPVIIVTGWQDHKDGLRALQTGAYHYLSKPLDLPKTESLIRSMSTLKEMQQKLELTEAERSWLHSLLDVTKAMQSQMETADDVLATISEATARLIGADQAVICLKDGAGFQVFPFPPPDGGLAENGRCALVLGQLSAEIIEGNHLGHIPDTGQEPDVDSCFFDAGFRSVLGVPIGNSGVIYVLGQSTFQFHDQARTVLEMLASHAEVAIANARLFELKEHRVRELEQLREVGRLMAEAVELPELLHRIADGVRSLLCADTSAIWPYDAAKGGFELGQVTIAGFSKTEYMKLHENHRAGRTATAVMKRGFMFIHDVDHPDYKFIGASSRRLFQKIGTKSVAAMSLNVENEIVGVLYVNFDQRRSFGSEDQATLEAFAAEAALAIKKARLYMQSQKSLGHLEATSNFMRLGKVDEPLGFVVAGVKDALGCGAVTLYRYDEKRKEIIGSPYTVGLKDEKAARSFRYVAPTSTLGQILESGEHYAQDALTDPVVEGPFIEREGVLSSAGFSLKVAKHTVGIMFANYRKPHEFTLEERRLLRTFANQCAIALRNAELYERQKKRSAHLRSLHAAGHEIIAKSEEDEILNSLLDKALEICSLSGGEPIFADIGIYDQERDEVRFSYTRLQSTFPCNKDESEIRYSLADGYDGRIGVAGRAIMTRKTQCVDDVLSDPDYIRSHPDSRSEIVVPLIDEQRVVGALNVEHPRVGGLDEYDQEALEILATQAVTAIQKAEQVQELRSTQNLLAARTAVAWMGMTSSTWRHEVNKYASTISDNIWLIRGALPRRVFGILRRFWGRFDSIEKYLRRIEKLKGLIQETPITAPLSAEEGVESIHLNALLAERVGRLIEAREVTDVQQKWELDLQDDARVRVSREWLRRAIDSLVHNALDAMEHVPRKELLVRTCRNDGRAEIHFIDRGKGIPKRVQRRLFSEPIPKKAGEKGSGVGLLLVQLIVQTYGGEISLVHSDRRGTEMAISLPLEGQ